MLSPFRLRLDSPNRPTVRAPITAPFRQRLPAPRPSFALIVAGPCRAPSPISLPVTPPTFAVVAARLSRPSRAPAPTPAQVLPPASQRAPSPPVQSLAVRVPEPRGKAKQTSQRKEPQSGEAPRAPTQPRRKKLLAVPPPRLTRSAALRQPKGSSKYLKPSTCPYRAEDLYWAPCLLGECNPMGMSDPYVLGHVRVRHFDDPDCPCVFLEADLIAPLIKATVLYGRPACVQKANGRFRLSVQKTYPYCIGTCNGNCSDAMVAILALNKDGTYLVSAYVTGPSKFVEGKPPMNSHLLSSLPDQPTILPTRLLALLERLRFTKPYKARLILGKKYGLLKRTKTELTTVA